MDHPDTPPTDHTERLPIPERALMSQAQQMAADAMINGPRKAIFGPFIPLLQTPALMERVGKLGESLRFDGALPARVRELVICAVARETSNRFEWQTHAPLALKEGISASAVDALAAGSRPQTLADDEARALDFVSELMRHHGVGDHGYAAATACFGAPGVIELTTLVGYFTMVCWVMNVARTPGPGDTSAPPLRSFPG